MNKQKMSERSKRSGEKVTVFVHTMPMNDLSKEVILYQRQNQRQCVGPDELFMNQCWGRTRQKKEGNTHIHTFDYRCMSKNSH